jgi:diketogulonate reductase-like aldo/keto reductase
MNFVEANGAKIPAIGLGTMTLMDAVCVEAVETALCVGYCRGLRAAHVEREDVFVTTKVWRDQLPAADFEHLKPQKAGALLSRSSPRPLAKSESAAQGDARRSVQG